MKNSLQNLIEILQRYDLGQAKLPEIAKEFVQIFERMQREAEKVSRDKKEEFAAAFIEMAHQLAALTDPYIALIPLSEENLLSSLDNPNYFDVDDWNSVQEAKAHIEELAHKLLPHLATIPKLEEVQESPKPAQKKPRASKSDWMKS